MIKSISHLLIISFLISSLSLANVQSIESEVNKPNVTSSSKKTTSTTTDENSGYKKDVKVINSLYEFQYKKFEPKDFTEWYDLLIQAISYEHYFKYIETGHITRRGDVLKPLENGAYPGTRVNIKDMTELAKAKISLIGLYDSLKRKEVLTDKGYINKTEFFTGSFEQYDFGFLLTAIKSVDLPINDDRLANELKNELYNFMLANSKVLVVNKLETTRYESNKDGFFDNLIDSLAGNFIGGLFYPDKIKTQKTTVAWSSNLNLNKYFDVYYMFNDFAFNDGYGVTRLFGKRNIKYLSYSLLADQDNTLFNDTITYRSYTSIPTAGQSFPFVGYGLSAYQVRDNIDSFQFYNLFGTFGSAFPVGLINFDFGLSYKNGTPKGVGFYWGYGADFLLFKPLSVFFKHNGAFQPKYVADLDDFINNWSYSQFQTGLKAHIGMLSLGAGYQWSTGMQGWTAFGSLTF